MPVCCVSSCTNYRGKIELQEKDIMYHKFPKIERLVQKWIAACCPKKSITSNSVVCSEHFKPDDYIQDNTKTEFGLPKRKKLKLDAIPSLLLPEYSTQTAFFDDDENNEILIILPGTLPVPVGSSDVKKVPAVTEQKLKLLRYQRKLWEKMQHLQSACKKRRLNIIQLQKHIDLQKRKFKTDNLKLSRIRARYFKIQQRTGVRQKC